VVLRLAAIAAAGLAVAAAPAVAQDAARVAPGVSASGVDLSGLTLDEATVRLGQQLAPSLGAPLVVVAAGRDWTLTPARSGFEFDAGRTARRALNAPPNGQVLPVLDHSTPAIRKWVADVASKVRRPGRDARLKVTLKRVRVTKSKVGKRLDEAETVRQIKAMLDDPAAPRVLPVKLTPAPPAVTDAALRRKTVVTVSKSEFKLRLFKRARLVKTYPVAVGQPAYPTPSGRFSIVNKQVNPVWSVPNSPWAGELAGTTVVGGSAANPLKARWMGIHDGVGIHGTGEEYSIGSRASHGCIRMRVADVIALYPRVPVGSVVLIK
jgi:lipoprotein-anchoring transpeptidase ErfK/SrfK